MTTGDAAGERPPDGIEVRAPRPAELDVLAGLWVDLAADQRAHGSHLLPEPNRTAVREALSRRLITGGLRVAVRDEPVGFVSFGPETGDLRGDATRGIVHNLFVRPDERDAGVGTALLGAAETALAADGAEVVAVEAMADNEAARRLYERRGYRPHRVEFERRVESDTSRD